MKVCSAIMASLVVLAAIPARAADCYWKSNTTGDWSEAANWVGLSPTNGDNVYITNVGANVILSGSTSNLNEFVINRTLTFTNWNTTLYASNVTLTGSAVVTLPTAVYTNQMSNNVYIVCTNLTINAGAQINANACGYRGTVAGQGPGGGTNGAGGGYGGRGGYGYSSAFMGGLTYGSLTAPLDPGSGGGVMYSYTTIGNGGGAIRIEASSNVTVNGTITANGSNGSGNDGGGGSGGGIYIACSTIQGSGAISARGGGGGSRYAGGGGGGRIAVIYDPAAQSGIPTPSITFSAQGSAVCGTTGREGELGTLYFPDNRFLTETIKHSGLWSVSGFTSWGPTNLTITNAWIRFPADGFLLNVTNDIIIRGSSSTPYRFELSNSTVVCGGSLSITGASLVLYRGSNSEPTLTIGDDLVLTNGGTLSLYPQLTNSSGNAVLTVGRDMLMGTGSVVNLYSGTTNSSTPDYGALVNVARGVFISGNSWIYPNSVRFNGGSPLFRMENLSIGPGAGFNANGLGFYGGSGVGYGPGGGSGPGGGGYGGAGGTGTGGGTYGSSNAPVHAGSGGGWQSSLTQLGHGGGLIRIEASKNVTLNGTLTVNGQNAVGNIGGGGAGGGIYVTCARFMGNGVLNANGGTSANGGGGGGGGRIAVWRVLGAPVSANAAGGVGGTANGATGTVVWVQLAQPGTLITVY